MSGALRGFPCTSDWQRPSGPPSVKPAKSNSFPHNRLRVYPAGERVGTVDVVEYEWGTDAQHLLNGRNGAANASAAGGAGYGTVICADCVYAGTSVEPLLASLCEVGGYTVGWFAYPRVGRAAQQGGSTYRTACCAHR